MNSHSPYYQTKPTIWYMIQIKQDISLRVIMATRLWSERLEPVQVRCNPTRVVVWTPIPRETTSLDVRSLTFLLENFTNCNNTCDSLRNFKFKFWNHCQHIRSALQWDGTPNVCCFYLKVKILKTTRTHPRGNAVFKRDRILIFLRFNIFFDGLKQFETVWVKFLHDREHWAPLICNGRFKFVLHDVAMLLVCFGQFFVFNYLPLCCMYCMNQFVCVLVSYYNCLF